MCRSNETFNDTFFCSTDEYLLLGGGKFFLWAGNKFGPPAPFMGRTRMKKQKWKNLSQNCDFF